MSEGDLDADRHRSDIESPKSRLKEMKKANVQNVNVDQSLCLPLPSSSHSYTIRIQANMG